MPDARSKRTWLHVDVRTPPESSEAEKRWLWVHCPWKPRGQRARLATYRNGRFVLLGERLDDPQMRLERIVHWVPAFGGLSAGADGESEARADTSDAPEQNNNHERVHHDVQHTGD